MYFHLIGIKEKDGEKYDLDILLQGGDENFIRSFLTHWGVVIVSLSNFKENVDSFGNILIKVMYKESEVQIICKGEDLGEKMYFLVSLGLDPIFVNFSNNPISDQQMKEMLDATFSRIEEENLKIIQKKNEYEYLEKKKYEESGIKIGLKIINSNIDRIEQVMKVGKGILSGIDMKELFNYMNELKKIRLGTNFNKMITLILESHTLLKKAENQLFKAYDDQKFLIDDNSFATNIDVLSEYLKYDKISDKAKIQPSLLSITESISSVLGINSVFLNLLGHDIAGTIEKTSIDDFLDTIFNAVEYIALCAIVTMCLTWLITSFLGIHTFSLYLLPALGWLGGLVYLLNNLNIKGYVYKIIGFIALAIIYRYGLKLLLNTFAM